MGSYERIRVVRALAETNSFWNIHQILAQFAPAAVGFIAFLFVLIRQREKLSGMSNAAFWIVFGAVLYAFVWALFCYVAGWALSFTTNYIWSSPAALFREQQIAINGLTKQLADATEVTAEPPLTRREQASVDFVQNAIKGATQAELGILNWILEHGEIETYHYRKS